MSAGANDALTAFETIRKEGDVALLRVDTNLYARESLFRACYQLSDRYYFFLRADGDHSIVVELRSKPSAPQSCDLIGEFSNELLSQQVRTDISRETRAIREMIVAQAFREADLNAG